LGQDQSDEASEPFLSGRTAQKVRASDIRAFVGARPAAGASNGEINRELALLRRAYRLGLKAERIYRAPVIRLLEERNVRQGFSAAKLPNAAVCEPEQRGDLKLHGPGKRLYASPRLAPDLRALASPARSVAPDPRESPPGGGTTAGGKYGSNSDGAGRRPDGPPRGAGAFEPGGRRSR
jgi:hypothetical protein